MGDRRGAPPGHGRSRGIRLTTRRVAIGLWLGVVVALVALFVSGRFGYPRTSPIYDPPVLAGQHLWGYCSAGFYARRGDTIVLTSTGHCTSEGTTATDPDGTGVRGVFGPAAHAATCDKPGKTCAASDLNYLVVAEDRVPWGHLNLVDMGAGGYREIQAGTAALRCEDVSVGDRVEINGRDIFRTGTVLEKGWNDYPQDGSYFPCMIAADIKASTGDSGGAVLVRGLPAGVTSRSFGGNLGFTPLAEGLEQLGLVLCTSPDCDLPRP